MVLYTNLDQYWYSWPLYFWPILLVAVVYWLKVCTRLQKINPQKRYYVMPCHITWNVTLAAEKKSTILSIFVSPRIFPNLRQASFYTICMDVCSFLNVSTMTRIILCCRFPIPVWSDILPSGLDSLISSNVVHKTTRKVSFCEHFLFTLANL